MTTLYLTVLGGMPALRLIKPEIADALRPHERGGPGSWRPRQRDQTGNTVKLVGWVVVTTVVGAVLTRRRAVQ